MAMPHSRFWLANGVRRLRSRPGFGPRPAVTCAANPSIAKRLLHSATLDKAEQLHQAADTICAAVATCPTQPAQRFVLSCLIIHDPLVHDEYCSYSMPVNQIETLFHPIAKDLVDLSGGMTVQLVLQAAQLQLIGSGLILLERDSTNVQCLQLQVDRLQQQAKASNAWVQVCQNTSSMLSAGAPKPIARFVNPSSIGYDLLPLEGLPKDLPTDRLLFQAACDVLLPANSSDYLVQMKRQAALLIAAMATQRDNPYGATAFVKWAYLVHRLSLLQVYRKVREPGKPQWPLPVFEGDPLFLSHVEKRGDSKTAREQGASLALSWQGWADALNHVAEQQNEGVVSIRRSVRYNAERGSALQEEECNIKAGRGTLLTQVLAKLRKQQKA